MGVAGDGNAFFRLADSWDLFKTTAMIKSHARHLIFSLLISFGVSVPALAQIAGGMTETTNTNLGGNNFIVGTVFWPSGRPINVRMAIKLASMTKGDIMANTDDNGQFIFSKVGAGNYFIVIDGEQDFEPLAQAVDISTSRNPVPQTYNVSVRLRDKTKSGMKPAVIDQASLGIPKRASEFFKKAGALSAAGDHKGAVEQLEHAIAEYPGFFDAYNELGVQYMQLNDLAKADATLQLALKIKANGFEPLVNRGITLFRLKRYPDAETSLRAAIAAKEQSAVAHYYLGRTQIGLEKYDAAETELNQAIKIGGDDMKEGHRMLANLFIQKGDDRNAVKELEIYLKLAPGAPDAANLRKVINQLKTPGPASPKPRPL